MSRRAVFPALALLLLVAFVLVWIPWDCRGPMERALGDGASGMALADARACDDGDAIACVNLAAALETAEGAARNLPLAVSLYRDGCDAGLSLACVNLAVLALADDAAGISSAEADRLLDASCRGGDTIACLRFGDAIAAGELPGRDFSVALHSWSTACNALLMPACVSIGRAMRDGRGVPMDLPAAHAQFAAACERGYPDGCTEASVLVVRGMAPGDVGAAVDQLERTCYAGELNACEAAINALVGTAYVHGDATDAERERATEAQARLVLLRERACSLGAQGHCAVQ